MQEWFGGVDQVRRCVATASGIGYGGDDLVIHCLAAASPGTPVENPRQVPAYLYSRRFGPTPPCFARATVTELEGRRLLLVAGTASIRGEESVHIGDLEAQTQETLINLRSVIAKASGGDERSALDLLREVRVYHPRLADGPALKDLSERAFLNVAEVELLRADLCRSELLVEIEGVALLS
jgi:enamine deaminase RidA (YjgF/YER057c/UK114 family)